jgi:anti-sigma regulatory factor (Ser/Thr protein kinase)
MTTSAYLALDAERERVQLVNAGHPPPLIVDPEGRASFLAVKPSVALGVTRGARYETEECVVRGGSTIVLYTDGVVEVRGEPLDVGLERMRRLAEDGYATPQALVDAIVEQMISEGRPSDDVAVLAVYVEELGDRLTTQWPAQADALAQIRHLLRRWLRHNGATDDEIYDITVASQEACANAVEHAYAPGEEAFEVDATIEGRAVEICVRDRGQWRRSRGTHRGRGMPMMEALMDSVHVQHTADGTTVVLRRDLGAGGGA